MRVKSGIFAALILGAAGAAHAADIPTKKPAPPAPPAGPASCTGPSDFIATDCVLSWYGITFYGTVDMGVGWESHGTPFNGAIATGVEELVQKNSNHAQWLATPGGLSQSNIGIKGKEEFAPGWSFIFDLNMGFDPYSLQIANGPKSMVENDGVPLAAQTSNADSARAGQFYNGAGYAGISNTTFGTLTFGRQNSLTLDGVNAYDPMGGSYAFSPIGWSGAAPGVGDTEDTRYTTALKYRIDAGMFRAAGLYQFGGYELNNASKDSFQLQAGADFNGGAYGKLSLDAIYSRDNDAISAGPLSAAQNLVHPGSIAVTLSDDTSLMLLAKYTYNQFKLSGGYEHINFAPPSDPQFANFTTLGGYTAFYTGVGGQINNTNYATDNRILNIMWVGGRYAFTDTLDTGVAYYHYDQPSFNTVKCSSVTISSKCSGTLDAVSFDVDWKFEKKFDVYAGLMFSQVGGGLANGYLYHNNIDPTAGVRFRF
jgi:predicted porin